MSTIEQFHDKIRRKVNDLTPKIASAYLAGLAALLALIDAHADEIDNGEAFVALVLTDANLNAAFAGYRAALIDAVRDAMRSSARAIPGMTSAQVATLPNILDANTLSIIRELDRQAMARITDAVRATARDIFREGGTRADVLANLRSSVGLGQTQWADVLRFRTAEATRTPPLTPAQLARSVTMLSERKIAANAATVSRTTALLAQKTADQMAWESAQELGVVPEGWGVFSTWRQIPRPTRRLEHVPLDGVTVPFGTPFPNGQVVPGLYLGGDVDWNCGCSSQTTMAPA